MSEPASGHTNAPVGSRLSQLVAALVALCITALGLGLYDLTIRQPRTPRLALIDIARLYAAAERQLKVRALAQDSREGREGVEGKGPESGTAPSAQGAPGALGSGLGPANFGPALQAVLTDMSSQCRCAIVAMATVVGADSTVPDYTTEVARRLGLDLREGARR